MEFSKITLYMTGTPCSRRVSRYQRLTDYIIRKYPENLGIFEVKRTETSKEYIKKLAEQGISPRLMAIEYELADGESGLMLYSSFIRWLIENGEL